MDKHYVGMLVMLLPLQNVSIDNALISQEEQMILNVVISCLVVWVMDLNVWLPQHAPNSMEQYILVLNLMPPINHVQVSITLFNHVENYYVLMHQIIIKLMFHVKNSKLVAKQQGLDVLIIMHVQVLRHKGYVVRDLIVNL